MTVGDRCRVFCRRSFLELAWYMYDCFESELRDGINEPTTAPWPDTATPPKSALRRIAVFLPVLACCSLSSQSREQRSPSPIHPFLQGLRPTRLTSSPCQGCPPCPCCQISNAKSQHGRHSASFHPGQVATQRMILSLHRL